MRCTISLVIATLVSLAPLALAAEHADEAPQQPPAPKAPCAPDETCEPEPTLEDGGPAWTPDCPEGHACIYSHQGAPADAPEETSVDPVEDRGNAWVEDCPEDMVCAANAPPQPGSPDEAVACPPDCGNDSDEGAVPIYAPCAGVECTSGEAADGDAKSAGGATIPAPAVALGLLAMLGAAMLSTRRRSE